MPHLLPELNAMITLAPFCIVLFAASLPLTYMVIIHRTLTGPAATDAAFDATAPTPEQRPRDERIAGTSIAAAQHA